MVADSTPDFYIEETKLCVEHGIQPYFALGHIHSLELVERMIRRGEYMGPMNGFFSTGGGGILRRKPVRPDGTRTPDAARLVLHVSNDVSFDAPDLDDDDRARTAHARRH